MRQVISSPTITDVIREKGLKPVNVSFFHFDSEYTTLNYQEVIIRHFTERGYTFELARTE